ncbi:ComEA family DNA-binding protein [Erysipelothrix aquatica]|uniref:ComEA family DNA-binding protein n=1 Tax=Erysipelothrix aquatica TaxID=2683714 RepID=UPI00135CE7EC|nr:helix-hairpin-helix domain-containing protein [Erysipelothrix aquatica]
MQRILFFIVLGAIVGTGIWNVLDIKRMQSVSHEEIQVTVIYNEKAFPIKMEPYATMRELLTKVELGNDVDLQKLNPERILSHRDVISIPVKQQHTLVSINHANALELEALPGVGPKMALDIIDYRDQFGLFQTLESLKSVKGMGPKKFEKLLPFIGL